MAKKVLKGFGLTGTPGVEYDLDELKDNNRENSSKELNVQVWYYDSEAEKAEDRNPNPPSLKMGQIWMSVNKANKKNKK